MAKQVTEFEKVLINRDNLSSREARAEKNRAHREIMDMIENGASYDEVEDMMLGDYGLEMDYLLDLI